MSNDAQGRTLMSLIAPLCTWLQLHVIALILVEIMALDVPGWYLMLIC